MPRTLKTERERAEYRLGVAQRAYERAVVAHGVKVKAAEAAYVAKTAAAATLAHRETDPALQDES